MFSKSCEYGIKAIIYIATQSLSGERVKISDIAENIDSPEAFTAKILGSLTKHEIVTSHKGPNGGFDIAPAAMDRIFLSDIVFAIDGDQIYNGCGLGLKECNAKRPCPMHQKFVSVRSELKRMLTTTSVRDLAAGIQSGKTTLIR